MLEMLCGFVFVAIAIVSVLYYPLLAIVYGIKCYLAKVSEGDCVIDIKWLSKYFIDWEDDADEYFIYKLLYAIVSVVYFILLLIVGFVIGFQQMAEAVIIAVYTLGTHLTIPMLIGIALFGMHKLLKFLFVFKRKLEVLDENNKTHF